MDHKYKTREALINELHDLHLEYDSLKLSYSKGLTKRKKAEEKNRVSENRYRALFNAIDEGFCIIEVIFDENEKAIDYRFLEVNPSFEKQTGFKNARGRRMRELAPEHEDYWFEIYGEIALTGQPARFEKRAEELHQWYDVYAFRFGPPENREVAILFNDITGRMQAKEMFQKSELKYRNLIDQAPDIILIVDAEGNLLHVNQIGQKLLGYSEDELCKMNTVDTYSIDEMMVGRHRLKEMNALRAGETMHFERLMRRKDGTCFPVEISVGAPVDGNSHAIIRDITERKQAEEALLKSEQRVRNITEQVIDVIFMTNKRGHITYISQSARSVFGYSPEEMISIPFVKFLTKSEIPRAMTEFNLSMRSGQKSENLTFLMKRKDESTFTGELTTNAYYENDMVTGIIGVIRDITERKQAEDELKEREARLQKIFEILPIGLWFADKNGKLIRGNPAGVKIWGAEPQVSIEEYGVFKARRLPSGQEIAPDDWALAHTIRTGVTITDEMLEIDTFDGTKKIILNYTAPVLDEKGQLQGAIVVNNDITVLRRSEEALIESEERFRRAILEAPIPMIIHDENNKCYQISKGWTKFSGYTLEDIPTIDDWTTRAFGERSGFVKAYIAKTFDINETVSNGEWNITTKDGHTRIWDFYATPIGLSSKGKRLLLSLAIDITENKLADEELKKAHEQLQQLYIHQEEVKENERKAISREIHDELGQSLSALKIDLGWIKDNVENTPEFKMKIKGMTDIVSSTIKIVQRISSDLRPGLLDDLGLAPAMEWYIQEFEKRTGIICHFKSEDIQSPHERNNLTLYRTLQEALTNVMRHANAKSVNINLYRSEDFIFLEIIDDGIGMKQEKIDSHKSLGFIGIRERVKQHDGCLDITSTNDKGTKLSIKIPFN